MLKNTNLLKEEAIMKQAEQALVACLREVPFLKIREVKRGAKQNNNNFGPDFIVNCQDDKSEKVLVVEVKTSGQPRLTRGAVNQLLVYLKNFPKSYAIFAAPYISPQAAEICVRDGIGYLDLAGNCLLSFGKVFIKKEGNPNPFVRKRDLRSLYSPKAERVLRALLNEPKRNWKIGELANEVNVSLGQVFNVKKLLADGEWLKTEDKGFCLQSPDALLKEWSENYSFRRNRFYDFYSMKSVSEIEYDLAILCQKENIPFALTGFSGCARVLPTVRYQRVMAYVEEEGIERIVKMLGLKEVSTGANVTLLAPYDYGVFYGKKNYDQTEVVCPIQLYLDLIGFRGRGEEAAQALLEEVIKFQ